MKVSFGNNTAIDWWNCHDKKKHFCHPNCISSYANHMGTLFFQFKKGCAMYSTPCLLAYMFTAQMPVDLDNTSAQRW